MDALNKLFWSETFWFPKNKTWKDFTNHRDTEIYVPHAHDLNWSLPLGVLLLFVRYVVEFHILTPFGMWVGVKEKKYVQASPNSVLEMFYVKNGSSRTNNNTNDLEAVAKQTDMTVREVEIWLRKRRKQALPSNIKKFRECGWHFIFYLISFVYGLVILWNKSWFCETKYCWKGWPSLHIANDVYWYYLVELSFYWCLVFSMLTDHKRKDFVQMIIHHIVTMFLLYFSWVVNFVRIGTLVLLVHDAADFPMAAAKMAKYCGRKLLCNILLATFCVTWVVSRLGFYPCRVLYSSSIEVYDYLEPFPAYYFFNGLLFILQVLHIIWTYMIARIAIDAGKGKTGDVRSDTSDDESDE